MPDRAMTPSESMHLEAMAIIRTANNKLDWSKLPATQKTYAGVPAQLADIIANAETAMRGGLRLEEYARRAAEREGSAA